MNLTKTRNLFDSNTTQPYNDCIFPMMGKCLFKIKITNTFV